MAKIEVTRTELVWPGKYNEDGTLREVPRVNLPFQVIETVNQSRATREAITRRRGSLEGVSVEARARGWLLRDRRTDHGLLARRGVEGILRGFSRLLFEGRTVAAPRKQAGHRALDDIRESLTELRYYREHLFRRPGNGDGTTA